MQKKVLIITLEDGKEKIKQLPMIFGLSLECSFFWISFFFLLLLKTLTNYFNKRMEKEEENLDFYSWNWLLVLYINPYQKILILVYLIQLYNHNFLLLKKKFIFCPKIYFYFLLFFIVWSIRVWSTKMNLSWNIISLSIVDKSNTYVLHLSLIHAPLLLHTIK